MDLKDFRVKLELTAQEMDVLFAGLKELPKKIADELFDKLLNHGKQQFQDHVASQQQVVENQETK